VIAPKPLTPRRLQVYRVAAVLITSLGLADFVALASGAHSLSRALGYALVGIGSALLVYIAIGMRYG
jgi:hypothetical protein